jgi:hypothetical protein
MSLGTSKMENFPKLSTGAVTQYPLPLGIRQGAQIIRFVDGSDQRFLAEGRQYRSWQLKLDLLNESELQQIDAFFDAHSGNYSTFTFPDPITGANVPNCRLQDSTLITEYVAVGSGSASLWILETNG